MGASDARGRDVGEAVIAALHPLRRSERPAASSAAPDVWTSPPARSAALQIACASLRSSTRIECDDRVDVSRVKSAVDGWINQAAQAVEVNALEVL